jgi:hypothetical protein
MTTESTTASTARKPELVGQTVVLMGAAPESALQRAGPAPMARSSSPPGILTGSSEQRRTSARRARPR